MIRIIVGLLIKIGLNEINKEEITNILELKNRQLNPAITAPAHGLFLSNVRY